MFRKIAGTLVSKLLVACISLALLFLTTQFLGTEGRGEISLLILNITFAIMISEFIGGAALVYLVPRFPLGNIMISSYLWSFISSLGVFALLLNQEFLGPAQYHVLALMLLQGIISIHIHCLLGLEKIKATNMITLVQQGILIISFSVLLYINPESGIFDFIIALYIANVIALIFSFIPLYPAALKFNFKQLKNTIKECFKYGSFVQFGNIAQFFNYRLSYYLLEIFGTTSQVGIYSTAVSIGEGFWLLSKSMAMVQYSAIANNDSEEYALNLTVRLFRITGVITFIGIIPLLWLPDTFYSYVFGRGFYEVGQIFLWLSPGIVIFSLSGILSHYFSGRGRHAQNAVSSILGFIVTIVLGWLIIPEYGIKGAAITATCSYFVSTLYQLVVFLHSTPVSFVQLIPQVEDYKYAKSLVTKLLNSKS